MLSSALAGLRIRYMNTSTTSINLSDITYEEQVPTSVETFWDRYTRCYITILNDQHGVEIESNTDGTKADRDASVKSFKRRIAEAK